MPYGAQLAWLWVKLVVEEGDVEREHNGADEWSKIYELRETADDGHYMKVRKERGLCRGMMTAPPTIMY